MGHRPCTIHLLAQMGSKVNFADQDRLKIDNDLYDRLGQRWYDAWDDPVALLRCESKEKLKWATPYLNDRASLLDIGCGAGFIANQIARERQTSQVSTEMVGLDQSRESLEVARRYDRTQSVNYIEGDAYSLPFEKARFDAVIAFDFLEHVSKPDQVIAEVSRVLKPQGVFLFHTFNRNWISWLIALKGVEWCVKNTPKNLHVYSMFITPSEVEQHCHQVGLDVIAWQGLRPRLNKALVELMATRIVPHDFEFTTTASRLISYCGAAIKTS